MSEVKFYRFVMLWLVFAVTMHTAATMYTTFVKPQHYAQTPGSMIPNSVATSQYNQRPLPFDRYVAPNVNPGVAAAPAHLQYPVFGQAAPRPNNSPSYSPNHVPGFAAVPTTQMQPGGNWQSGNQYPNDRRVSSPSQIQNPNLSGYIPPQTRYPSQPNVGMNQNLIPRQAFNLQDPIRIAHAGLGNGYPNPNFQPASIPQSLIPPSTIANPTSPRQSWRPPVDPLPVPQLQPHRVQQPTLPTRVQQPTLPTRVQQPTLPTRVQQPTLPTRVQQPALPEPMNGSPVSDATTDEIMRIRKLMGGSQVARILAKGEDQTAADELFRKSLADLSQSPNTKNRSTQTDWRLGDSDEHLKSLAQQVNARHFQANTQHFDDRRKGKSLWAIRLRKDAVQMQISDPVKAAWLVQLATAIERTQRD